MMSQNSNMLNVGLRRNQHDQHSRWKMPALQISKTGRGKNQKTHLTNLEDIAAHISRGCDPRFLHKFLSIEMNTSSKFNSDGGFYLKGVHKLSILQEKIHNYIEHFAVCPDCSNPRLKLSASKQKLKKLKNKLEYRCNACGKKGVLKAKHKNAGKMFKYMCNILIADKKKNRKTKRSRDEELASSAQEEEVAAWHEEDFDDWVVDSGPERAIQERAKETPLTEPDLVPETTPQGLLREVLNDPNKTLLDRTAEFNRILSARRIEDELKIARIVTKSTLDFSSKDTLLESIQKE